MRCGCARKDANASWSSPGSSPRAGAPVAAECYIDHSPPPPRREERVPVAARERSAGHPTKRERRSIDKLLGRPAR